MYIIQKLTKELQKKYAQEFNCGNDALTNFLKSYEAIDNSFGATYVMISEGSKIIGYYNISTGHIEEDTLQGSVRMGGTVYINCLALDQRYQKMKFNDSGNISDLLLADCINRIMEIRENYIGFSFVTLSSTEEGYNLYKRNGFYELEEDMSFAKNSGELKCTPMYLPLDYE